MNKRAPFRAIERTAFLGALNEVVVKRDVRGSHSKKAGSGTPIRGAAENARYRGYHFAAAPFNPRLQIFEPFGFKKPGTEGIISSFGRLRTSFNPRLQIIEPIGFKKAAHWK